LIAGGAPLPHIQARLGHESITTTIDTYGHLLPAGDELILSPPKTRVRWSLSRQESPREHARGSVCDNARGHRSPPGNQDQLPGSTAGLHTQGADESWRSDPFQVTLEVAFLMVNAARSARLPTSARLLA
jgi:hypothetical protein